jgi:hypothetical protein
MSGGTGGSGGSPNGVTGATGASTSISIENNTELTFGGAGGVNGSQLTLGSTTYGPFGSGGTGGDSVNITGNPGQSGGVVLWWGNGVNG